MIFHKCLLHFLLKYVITVSNTSTNQRSHKPHISKNLGLAKRGSEPSKSVSLCIDLASNSYVWLCQCCFRPGGVREAIEPADPRLRDVQAWGILVGTDKHMSGMIPGAACIPPGNHLFAILASNVAQPYYM